MSPTNFQCRQMADKNDSDTLSKQTHDPATTAGAIVRADKGKGKMIVAPTEGIDIADINPSIPNQIIEVKAYRKWVSKNVPDPNPTGLCFILLDRRVRFPYSDLLYS